MPTRFHRLPNLIFTFDFMIQINIVPPLPFGCMKNIACITSHSFIEGMPKLTLTSDPMTQTQ